MLNDALPSDADITSCDLEPIHIPGSIQPHGIMLIVNNELKVIGAAGDIEGRLTENWAGRALIDLVGGDCVAKAARVEEDATLILGRVEGASGYLNAIAYRSAGRLVVEMDAAERSTGATHMTRTERLTS